MGMCNELLNYGVDRIYVLSTQESISILRHTVKSMTIIFYNELKKNTFPRLKILRCMSLNCLLGAAYFRFGIRKMSDPARNRVTCAFPALVTTSSKLFWLPRRVPFLAT